MDTFIELTPLWVFIVFVAYSILAVIEPRGWMVVILIFAALLLIAKLGW